MVDLDYHAASSLRIEINLIVPEHPGDVLAKTSKKAPGALMATPFISATGTRGSLPVITNRIHK